MPLLELQLMHPYYADRLCPDFDIEPTAETRQLLANYRCILKSSRSGIRIFAQVTDASEQVIKMPSDIKLTFYLRLHNPDFALFTDLTDVPKDGVPLLTNKGQVASDPIKLAWQSRQESRTDWFIVQQPVKQDHYVLRMRPLGESNAQDFQINGLNMPNQPSGVNVPAMSITVDTSGNQPGDTFAVTYPVMPKLPNNVWAEVEILNIGSLPAIAQGPGQFQVSFSPKPVRWVYYVILNSASAEPTIEDAGTPDYLAIYRIPSSNFFTQDPLYHHIVFGMANRTNLQEQPDPTDAIAEQLAAQYPDRQRWRFVSDDEIPCQEAARKSIKLQIAGSPVIDALPNPSPRTASKELTINGALLLNPFYQVVPYFSND